jgi:hypothetical protein
VFTTPVSTFLTVTPALGTVAPDASNIVPVKFPLVVCAINDAEISVDITSTKRVYSVLVFKNLIIVLKDDLANCLSLITTSRVAIRYPKDKRFIISQ